MSMRYKGAIISATAPTVSSSQASGAWTLQQQLQYVGMNTTANAGSVNFQSSPASSYFSFSMPVSYFPATGDFTLEFWLNTTDSSTLQGVVDLGFNSGGFGFYFQSGLLRFRINGADEIDATFNANTLRHVAVVRSGDVLSSFLNGSRVGNATNLTNITPASTRSCYIGCFNGAGLYPLVNSAISNLRYVKGTAVYNPSSTTLTVPTTQLTAVSGTQLLTCQLPSLTTDYSTNSISITNVNGQTNLTSGGPTFSYIYWPQP